jgi:hypothetical protein
MCIVILGVGGRQLCVMEMSDGNKSGFPQPWMVGIGEARPTCLGNCSIVTMCGTPRTPIEGTPDASHIVTPVT